MDNLLEKFFNHDILIDVRKATNDELKELEEAIDVRYVDGQHLYPRASDNSNFLHFRGHGCTYSDNSVDYNNGIGIPVDMICVSYSEFIKPICELTEDELMSVYK